jgi:hypothetical protein
MKVPEADNHDWSNNPLKNVTIEYDLIGFPFSKWNVEFAIIVQDPLWKEIAESCLYFPDNKSARTSIFWHRLAF